MSDAGEILIEPRAAGGHAAALFLRGRLEDLLIDPEPADPTPRPEAIHRAVVDRPMKGIGGAIVALGGGEKGFLRMPRAPEPGARLLVQVAGWAEPGKAPPVRPRPTLKSRAAVLTPGAPGRNLSRELRDPDLRARLGAIAAAAMAGAAPDLGLILRSAAADLPEAEIAAEIAALRAQWERIAAAGAGPAACLYPGPGAAEIARREWRTRPGMPVIAEPGAFDRHELWEEIRGLGDPRIALDPGTMFVEPTRALVAVDVNTGGDLSPAAALKTNLAAARALPRALRLRGLGGQITVDFAPLAKPDRRRIEIALTDALRADPVETSLAGWSPLGHLELSRKRARRPLG